jgi:hypothetical protein
VAIHGVRLPVLFEVRLGDPPRRNRS